MSHLQVLHRGGGESSFMHGGKWLLTLDLIAYRGFIVGGGAGEQGVVKLKVCTVKTAFLGTEVKSRTIQASLFS